MRQHAAVILNAQVAVKSNHEDRSHLLAIGVIAKVFGVKGEVKVHSYSRSSQEFEKLGTVLTGKKEAAAVAMKIENVATRGADIYLKFQDVNDRNGSEALVGHFLFVEEKARKHLAPGEFFIDDIIGMSVHDSREKTLGVVRDVVRYPAQDVYVVKTEGGDVMVPAVKGIVRRVDVKNRTIEVDPPEGLFGGRE
ncbi:MAG TPA: ribosome maturation factor RimM [Bacteroidota bacterium]|nr:ribosome maturation factor RimM [Bacteroidota bacterium]